jgi:hypothetical protein
VLHNSPNNSFPLFLSFSAPPPHPHPTPKATTMHCVLFHFIRFCFSTTNIFVFMRKGKKKLILLSKLLLLYSLHFHHFVLFYYFCGITNWLLLSWEQSGRVLRLTTQFRLAPRFTVHSGNKKSVTTLSFLIEFCVGSGEDYITKSFMLCTPHQVSFG